MHKMHVFGILHQKKIKVILLVNAVSLLKLLLLCYCKEGNLSWSLIGVKRFKEKTGLSILTDLDKWNMFIPPVVGHHLKFYIW